MNLLGLYRFQYAFFAHRKRVVNGKYFLNIAGRRFRLNGRLFPTPVRGQYNLSYAHHCNGFVDLNLKMNPLYFAPGNCKSKENLRLRDVR